MIIFEIDDNYVKALWGGSVLGDVQVNGMVLRPLETATQEELNKVLLSIINEKEFRKSKPVVLCIPRHQTTLRNLKFPARDKKELDNIISLNLTQEVPYSREEIIYNYEVLDKNPTGFTNVLLCIIHRQTLVKQFSVLEKLNLYPDNILLSTSGLIKFLHKAKVVKVGETELKACVDIGDKFTDFFVFKENRILLSKSIDIGSSQLKEADKLSKFIGELKQAMVVFPATRQENLSRFYIAGVKTRNVELEKELNDKFQIPVETINPLEAIKSLKGINDIGDISTEVSVSAVLGTALEPMSTRFNFVLPEAKMRKNMRDIARNLFMTGGIVSYLIVLVLLGFIGKIHSRQVYLDKVSSEVMALEHKNGNVIEALEKIKAFERFTKPRDSFLYYYYELSKIAPPYITVERLIFVRGKEFSMIGKSTDMGEIFKFVRELNNAKIFGKVELRYSRKKTKGKTEFNEFDLMCHIE